MPKYLTGKSWSKKVIAKQRRHAKMTREERQERRKFLRLMNGQRPFVPENFLLSDTCK